MAQERFVRGFVITLAAVLWGGVTACIPPMPPDVLAARAEADIDCASGDVVVGVPEQFAGAAMSVASALMNVCPDETVTEVVEGAPASVTIVDAAPSAQQRTDASAACQGTPLIVIPAFAYPVTLSYNIVGLEGLVMTPAVVAGILSGAITRWDDPSIVAANPDYDLTGLPPISLMSASRTQGSVEAMTAWLVSQAPESWPMGQTGVLDAGSTFPTTGDLVTEMLGTEGSVAVLPVSVAISNGLAMASLPVRGTDVNGVVVDQVVSADDVQLMKVGSGATTLTPEASGGLTAAPAVGGFPVEGNFDLAASKIVLSEGAGLVGWPVLGYAHALVCDDAKMGSRALGFAQYLVRLAGQGALETFGVTPLPEPIRVRTFAPLKGTVELGPDDDPTAFATASPS